MVIKHYFAYGSNMDPERVTARGVAFSGIRSASLHGFRLVFDNVSRHHPHASHANIVYAPGELVEGVLYRLAAPEEIVKMDLFERAPVNYGRDALEVASEGERIPAWTYFANRAVRRDGFKPPRSYLNHLLAGRPYLSREYYRRLQALECVD